MRAAEQRHLLDQVGGFPAQPWLWLSPCATWLPAEAPAGRGVRLHRAADGRGWDGDVCCALPLPLPSEAVNAIILQHVAALDLEPLLSECARVLMPGGRLWMTLLNRYSPYRARWQWQGPRPPSATRCQLRLQREGLRVRSVRHFGPLWSDAGPAGGKALPALRAVCVLEFEKRAAAFIGPEAARPVGWGGQVAT
ncbi:MULTISPECIES: class I SAM-dependent methyltransferase [Stenotrophomonas]|jgi:SAM-dependent methyltransferase|uniref:class I SAM-dependent methyltransferase n=1 Tax=Stenotrophomonas TaxID=40323 RepID=UPI001CF5C2FC|nr:MULTISPECIES: class I SAM-dependent methyltransferase [Stenotrophomonas]MCA7024399.1 class I SAM-dependent methyltransferase [Stenotrophomonas acidaminiphila]MCE4076269.1 class I SAM-dependent methyltransferase [Stenotrophomonas acidaminiphila]WHL19678.1 class I SAM-dependent methyltransferase [Stenotrophomonas acidaminiphila]